MTVGASRSACRMSALEKLQEIVAAARIKPAVVQVESHPYLPEWDLLDFCREHGIVLLAFAALGHGMEPKVLDDPVITGIAQRVHKTPAQVALAWAVQRGTAFLTTSTTPGHIQENFEISALPEDAMREIRDGITTNVRFNTVVETGVPGFIPRTTQASQCPGAETVPRYQMGVVVSVNVGLPRDVAWHGRTVRTAVGRRR